MALKAYLTAEEQAGLGDSLKGLYVEQGDGFRLDVESVGGWALEDVGGLRKMGTTERSSRKAAEARVSELERELAKAMEASESLRADLESKGAKPTKDQIDAAFKPREEGYLKDIAKRDEAYSALEKQLQRTLVQNAAREALSKHRGRAELLMPHIESSARAVRGEDGQYGLRVIGQSGEELLSGRPGNASAYMDLDELVVGFKSRFPEAFEGTNQSGSGAPNGSSGRSGPRIDMSLPPSERIRQGREQGIIKPRA